MPFVTLPTVPAHAIFGGLIQGRYAHLEQMTIGEVELAKDTEVPMHRHAHEQLTYVISGRFEFTIDGETTVLEPRTAALIPGNALHGGRTLTDCRVIDVFAPVREEYRGATGG